MAEKRQRVLNGRYAISDVLGQGGMAKVFRGTDNVLGRTVAVKVLAPQFADDEQFVARFRREAQAAAGLNHPNIVSVFDTGSQNGVHYIVMEYVEGRTLRDVIRQDAPLLPQRANEITAAVARALGSAHESSLVHRDIKPGNIMLTRDGEVKVMDFGIARTTTGDTLTQTAAILGTALYLSPEQAQGQGVDARSDIYSLGCVLYEMLTARSPFTGDSPVSIAYKHVRETPPLPSEINPDVPPELDAVVMKMLAKNPDNRYQSAGELEDDLTRIAGGTAPLATPILPGTATEVFASSSPSETAVLTQAPRVEPPPPDERGDRRKIWPWILGILFLAALAVGAFFLIRSLDSVPQIGVPNVEGATEERARSDIRAAGLEPVVERDFSAVVDEGRVIEQDPDPGEQVDEGSPVTIVVSKGPEPVKVPGVIGLSQAEAEDAITAEGLRVEAEFAFGDQPEGIVTDQSPDEGTELVPGRTVTIVVSQGPQPVVIPTDIVCEDFDTAIGRLQELGLSPVAAPGQRAADCPEGTVATTTPAPGTEVEAGSSVTVFRTRPQPEPSPTPTETPTENPSP